ncbi:esterase [Ramlibacter sp. G-1-2-2]|uniref:Esterase n=1 Tax=Ramlibacter agri TaxID=2728837 RepID=A0A848GYK4_9BURK|nr:esterase [Ramlibacter agri]NML43665.1 esterase [Ramlibacter agri]
MTVILQAPALPTELVLLFHGVGATPEGLAPVGQHIAAVRPSAFIASVQSPDASDLGGGYQWFSVRGVTEENRPARVQETLPRFLETVRAWQQRAGVGAEQTTLVGFSQGAIMSLAAAVSPQAPASQVVSLSGRFDALPQRAPQGVRFHFVHGTHDPVIAASHASEAAERLKELGAEVTLDLIPGLAHGVDRRALDAVLRYV